MLTLNEIKETVSRLVEDYPVRRVILIGSYARGDATEKSDVDLIIDYGEQLSYWDFLGLVGHMVKKMPIQVDVLGLDEIKKPDMLHNIQQEGVIVYERTH